MSIKSVIGIFAVLTVMGLKTTPQIDLHGERSSAQVPIEAHAIFPVQPTQLVTPSDADRGCCLIKTARPQCAATNRGFCRKLAADNNASFEFYKGAQCRNVAHCPVRRE